MPLASALPRRLVGHQRRALREREDEDEVEEQLERRDARLLAQHGGQPVGAVGGRGHVRHPPRPLASSDRRLGSSSSDAGRSDRCARSRAQRRERLTSEAHQPAGRRRAGHAQGVRHHRHGDRLGLCRVRLHAGRRARGRAHPAPPRRRGRTHPRQQRRRRAVHHAACADRQPRARRTPRSRSTPTAAPTSGRGFHVIRPTLDRRPDGRHLRRVAPARPRAARRLRAADRSAARDLRGRERARRRAATSAACACPTSRRCSSRPPTCATPPTPASSSRARFRKRIARGIAEGVIDFLSP